ncbi:unnamed protein product [Phytomonas sp. Hart1]|nr:unnamed protein product [Phytomonas sp. Hart1]|eukprot:CCW70785.1 unnamed protein product [Phytomonas sp. isolate Hart1]
MLTWVEEEVASPYGPVRTRYWAVPASPDAGGSPEPEREGPEPNPPPEDPEADAGEGLEEAEDELGAVLWNSNGAALGWLRGRFFAPPRGPNGRRIVELGAGVGVIGIALAMGGATVAITDLKALLPLLRFNIARNRPRVRERSRGAGHCEALEWRWGPTEPINIRKRLKKRPTTTPDEAGNDAGLIAAVVEALRAIRQPSLAMRRCQGVFAAPHADARTPKRAREAAPPGQAPPVDLGILCDALYGNPKDWPGLLYTLSEILETNPADGRVVNFCEQRVKDVEGPFLKLLEDENAAEALCESFSSEAPDDARVLARALIERCRGHTSAGEVDFERLNHAILAQVSREKRRGVYEWNFTTTTLDGSEGKSDLGMIIHATTIMWKKKKTTRGGRPEKTKGGENAPRLSDPARKRSKNEIEPDLSSE